MNRLMTPESEFTLVPKLLRTAEGWIGGTISGGLVVLLGFEAFNQPSKVIPIVILLLLFVGILWTDKTRTKIIVRKHTVHIANFPGLRVDVDRHRISRITVFSYWIVFSGSDGKMISRSRPYWSHEQLRELAETLQVPLDIRRRMWLFNTRRPRV